MPNKKQISSWEKLITSSQVMSLATCGKEGAWSAPVYYLFEKKRFYFFSNHKSRHIMDGLNQTIGASIFRDDPDFTRLSGIQMSGTIQLCPVDLGSMGVATKYCHRFGLQVTDNILDFFAGKFHASLYVFNPLRLFYMDNRQGFGARDEIAI